MSRRLFVVVADFLELGVDDAVVRGPRGFAVAGFTLLGLSLREPELAAYQLVKLFLLLGGSISAESDSQLADLSMRYRETRCPQPMS